MHQKPYGFKTIFAEVTNQQRQKSAFVRRWNSIGASSEGAGSQGRLDRRQFMGVFSNFGPFEFVPQYLVRPLDFGEFPTILRRRFRSGPISAGVKKMRRVNVLAGIGETRTEGAAW
jgi:hypothetical protein